MFSQLIIKEPPQIYLMWPHLKTRKLEEGGSKKDNQNRQTEQA